MGIRETLNKNRVLSTGITAGIIVLALIFIVYQLSGSGSERTFDQAYFTTDDGATWFPDDIGKHAPFQKDGKTAYRVFVFKCADGEAFASHLQRLTPEAKERLAALEAAGEENFTVQEQVERTGIEVKRPGTGDEGWVLQSSAEGSQIVSPVCPDGTGEGIQAVYP